LIPVFPQLLGITPTPDPAVIAETPETKVIGAFLVMIHNKLTGKTISFQDIPHLRLPGGNEQDPLSETFSSSHQLPPSANSLKPDQTIKVVLLGDRAVGKTALFERWKNGLFVPTTATIGIELWTRLYSCKGKIIQVQVWDTAGQELHNAITRAYYRHAQGVFLVYDITSTESFQNISNWSKKLLDVVPEDKKIHFLMVGNKKDLERERSVSVAEAQEYANARGYKFIETSAKQGNECQKSFQLLFQDIYKSDIQNSSENDTDSSPKLDSPYRQDNCSCSS